MSTERAHATAAAAGLLGRPGHMAELALASGIYHAELRRCRPVHQGEYLRELQQLRRLDSQIVVARRRDALTLRRQRDELEAYLQTLTEHERDLVAPNTVLTAGKNFLLDNGLAGSAYTASFFLGLISSASFSAIVAGDTAASHAGWLEGGATNAPTYSGARKTAAWAAASGGSKALSAGLVFTFTGSGTVKGCFLTTASAVDATSGTMYSAGLFSGGDQPMVSTNTLTVSYSASL